MLKGVSEAVAYRLIKWCAEHDIVLDILNILYDESSQKLFAPLWMSMSEIEKFVERHFIVDRKEEYTNKYSLPSTRLILNGGGQINLKSNQVGKQNLLRSCHNCSKKEYCREGIMALRLTNLGEIKPCLFRNDNYFDLKQFIAKNYDSTTIRHALYKYIMQL